MSTKYLGIGKYLKNRKNIFDVGIGPKGSDWWSDIDKDAKITGCDLYFFPKTVPENVTIFKYNASKLNRLNRFSRLEVYRGNNHLFHQRLNLTNKFDMVVANHVLEHVESPKNLIKGISKIIKKDGLVYIGFPESTNFTDIFYHLIHAEGGGHIQKLTKDTVLNLFTKEGFKTIHTGEWPDDWLWFETQFDFKSRKIKYTNQKEITYLANVFRKELTLKKGYYYGWEMVFKKL
jgi:SAM-dependent methyltransferase